MAMTKRNKKRKLEEVAREEVESSSDRSSEEQEQREEKADSSDSEEESVEAQQQDNSDSDASDEEGVSADETQQEGDRSSDSSESEDESAAVEETQQDSADSSESEEESTPQDKQVASSSSDTADSEEENTAVEEVQQSDSSSSESEEESTAVEEMQQDDSGSSESEEERVPHVQDENSDDSESEEEQKPRAPTKVEVPSLEPKKKKAKIEREEELGDDEIHLKAVRRLLEAISWNELAQILANATTQNDELYSNLKTAADSRVAYRQVSVRDLAVKTGTKTLRTAFKRFGKIDDGAVIYDKSGKSRGFGFITFTEVEAAVRAAAKNSIIIDGHKVSCREETLREQFKQFGELEDITVVIDRVTRKSKGYAFITYRKKEGASAALKNPPEKIDGRKISCSLATLRNKNDKRDGGKLVSQ
ncbi:RNA-binding domain containing hypothetical protein [Phytophthora palmivora]|uniref:RRM domain-containing protein n=1 Tax=Phytophthora palmivora TaxID=4796 RepID=A0A2P4WZC6_9STRA|nr:RNA-binding domain containing hypothetical protein [Phytophthora palmivora]